MAIVLSDNIQTNAQSPTDSRYYNGLVPYASVSAVNAAIVSGVRYTGLTVNIVGVEYWYCNGIGNGNLVVKSSGGQLSWTGSTANGIGTYVSSAYICSQPNLTFNGTTLNISGNVCATSCIRSPLITGGTVCGSVSITSPKFIENGICLANTYAKSCLFIITGNSSNTGFTVNHALSKQFVSVQVVRAASPYATIYTDVQRPNTNCVCIFFDTAPPTGTNYCILITG
jgi:hypothetical protein